MLAVMALNTEIVFVRLLDEGTEVMRPVPAVNISENVYRLFATIDYDPKIEMWEFLPDSKVRCEPTNCDSSTIMLAVELILDSE